MRIDKIGSGQMRPIASGSNRRALIRARKIFLSLRRLFLKYIERIAFAEKRIIRVFFRRDGQRTKLLKFFLEKLSRDDFIFYVTKNLRYIQASLRETFERHRVTRNWNRKIISFL